VRRARPQDRRAAELERATNGAGPDRQGMAVTDVLFSQRPRPAGVWTSNLVGLGVGLMTTALVIYFTFCLRVHLSGF
jgi:hypothetical protein